MRQIKMYAAISLNGMIAKQDGDLRWLESLPNPEKTDYGYEAFIKTCDATIQGFKTYEVVLNKSVEMPTKHLTNYVFTRQQNLKNTPFIEFISKDHLAFSRALKKQNGKDIWLIGGGQMNTFFLNHHLVDKLYIFIMPVIIENGIKLFEELPIDQSLKLVTSRRYESGAVLLEYNLKR